jgi:hypothetical protein
LPPSASAGSLVRAPPCFRTSAGHRGEGRNPWHLQHSRHQLHAGTPCRRLVRSLSLRPSWLLASWADQTENARRSQPSLGLYVRASSPQVTPRTAGYDYGAKWGIAPAGLPPASTAVSLAALPPVGPLGLSSPPSPVLCSAKTATLPISGRFACRSLPDTLSALLVRVVPYGLMAWARPPDHTRAFGHPVPHSGHVTRRQRALPSSRATPIDACPALRPRWCPAHSP